MKARLIAVGENAPAWVAAGFEEYRKRLSHWLPLDLIEIEPGVRGKGRDAVRATFEEGQRVLAAIPKGATNFASGASLLFLKTGKAAHVVSVVVDGRVLICRAPRVALLLRGASYAYQDEIIGGADIFLGLSAGGVLTAEMVKKMADKPIILAMANPEPEIRPELAKQARPDCLIGTGRSDYPNQVNNSLCFPFIFRGALDAGEPRLRPERGIHRSRRRRGTGRLR